MPSPCSSATRQPGGLLRFGIPDFKLEKWLIDRRVDQLLAEGVRIEVGSSVGPSLGADDLAARFDAVLLATGAQRQRPLRLPGADLHGVEPAMAYLTGRNRTVAGRPPGGAITAAGKHVVVLGGGDTSADCLGSALREGAASVTEIAHGPTPPARRTPLATWPEWPFLLRTYRRPPGGGQPRVGARADGARRRRRRRARRARPPGHYGSRRRPPARRARRVFPADLVLVAIGFAGVEHDPVYAQLGIDVASGTVAAGEGGDTGVPGVFAAGDCVRGADLIVTAIAGGRAAAAAVHARLAQAAAAPAA